MASRIEDYWREGKPAILCYPTAMIVAEAVAQTLTQACGFEVGIVVTEYVPPTNNVFVFDPGHKIPPEALEQLKAQLEGASDEQRRPRLSQHGPEEAARDRQQGWEGRAPEGDRSRMDE